MKINLLFIISLLFVNTFNAQNSALCKVENLKCEHLFNPIGIDNPNPRLS